MELIDLIIAQCRVQNVPEKYAQRVLAISGITEEKDGNITAAVKSFKENVLPAIQEAQSSTDSAAQKAIEEYEKKHGIKDGKAVEAKEGIALPDNLDPSIKAFIESQAKVNQKMQETIEALGKTQSNNQKLELVRAKMKGKIEDGFIDDYIGQVNLEADNIDTEVERVAKSYTDMKQKFLNKAVEDGNYQPTGGGKSGASDKDIDAFIESKSKESEGGPFGGIEI